MVATERQALLALSVPARPNLDNLSASDKNLIQDWWVACWDGPPPPPEGGSRNDWWKSSKHMHEKRYKVAVKRYKLLPNPAIAESTLASASSIVGLTQAGAAAIAALQAAAPPLATGHELVAPMDAPVDAHSLEASSLPIVFNGVELQGRMHLGDDWVARQYPNVTNLSSGRPVVTASGGHAVRRLSATVQSPGGRQGAAVDYVVYTLPAVESGEAMPRMDAHARHRMQGRHHAREAAAVKRLGTSFQKLGFARDNDMARKADFEKTLRLAFAAQLELCMPSEESSTTTAGNGKARRLSEEHGTEDDDMEEDDDGDGHAGDDTYASFETAGGGALDDLDELGSGTGLDEETPAAPQIVAGWRAAQRATTNTSSQARAPPSEVAWLEAAEAAARAPSAASATTHAASSLRPMEVEAVMGEAEASQPDASDHDDAMAAPTHDEHAALREREVRYEREIAQCRQDLRDASQNEKVVAQRENANELIQAIMDENNERFKDDKSKQIGWMEAQRRHSMEVHAMIFDLLGLGEAKASLQTSSAKRERRFVKVALAPSRPLKRDRDDILAEDERLEAMRRAEVPYRMMLAMCKKLGMSDASSEVAAKVGQLCQVEWLNEFNEEENFTFRPTVALGDYMHGTYQKSDPAHFTHVSADVVLPKALASHRLSREDKDRIAKAPDPFAVPPEKSPEETLKACEQHIKEMDAAPPAPKKTALHELNVEDDALVRDAALHAVASLQGEHWSFEGEEDVILTVGADAWRLCKPALHAIVKHTAAVVAEDVEAARAMVAVCVGAVGFATVISTRCKEQKKTSSCLNDTLPIQGVQDMDAVAFAGAPKSANAFSLKGITRYPVVKAALCGEKGDQACLGKIKHALSQYVLRHVEPLMSAEERAAFADFKLTPRDPDRMEEQMLRLGRIPVRIYRLLPAMVRAMLFILRSVLAYEHDETEESFVAAHPILHGPFKKSGWQSQKAGSVGAYGARMGIGDGMPCAMEGVDKVAGLLKCFHLTAVEMKKAAKKKGKARAAAATATEVIGSALDELGALFCAIVIQFGLGQLAPRTSLLALWEGNWWNASICFSLTGRWPRSGTHWLRHRMALTEAKLTTLGHGYAKGDHPGMARMLELCFFQATVVRGYDLFGEKICTRRFAGQIRLPGKEASNASKVLSRNSMPCGGHPSAALLDACGPTGDFWSSMCEGWKLLELVSGLSKRDALKMLIDRGAAPVRDTTPALVCVEEHDSAEVTDAYTALLDIEPMTRHGNLNATVSIMRRVFQAMADVTLRRRLVFYQSCTEKEAPKVREGFGCPHCKHVEGRHFRKHTKASAETDSYGLDDDEDCTTCTT